VTEIVFELNGFETRIGVEGGELLVDVLRDRLGCTGTKVGCGEGECGACSVIVDGRLVCSCLVPVLEVEGKSVTTIEGLVAPDGQLSLIQRAFVDHGGIQCGFCSPGMILSTKVLLDRHRSPSDAQIRTALEGNLCRCTGYVQIVDSVREAALALRTDSGTAGAPGGGSQ